MTKDVILIAVHGMGDTSPDFASGLYRALASELGDDWLRVHTESVYYQPVLQEHQERVMGAMEARPLRWTDLRKFMLYGFSDAAGLERLATEPGSPYERAQDVIASALGRAFDACGDKPVVLIAHSLGAHVISNYIWDAQQSPASRGVFRQPSAEAGSPRDQFVRLRRLRHFYTTGCNIPIIVGGFPEAEIKPIRTTGDGYAIRWDNYYDADDVLGWPLQPLSAAYAGAVNADHPVNAGGSLLGTLVASWNPFSHLRYWADSEVLQPLARDLHGLMP